MMIYILCRYSFFILNLRSFFLSKYIYWGTLHAKKQHITMLSIDLFVRQKKSVVNIIIKGEFYSSVVLFSKYIFLIGVQRFYFERVKKTNL